MKRLGSLFLLEGKLATGISQNFFIPPLLLYQYIHQLSYYLHLCVNVLPLFLLAD